jgi:Zn-dependent metalloprotease
VFNPNPVVALRNENITDKNDANQAVLNPAYKDVSLSFLDDSGFLRGQYARIMNKNVASSPSGTFNYQRKDDHFEQVSAYFDITEAQKYLRSLGFTNVNNDSQKVFTNTIPDDNSFYDPEVDEIVFGNGGVDDAEDQEVVWHELGHAIQDSQVPDFGLTEQAGAIGEGFGDYWAVTMSQPVSNGFDLPCVMDWDATSYTSGPRHCLRRTDGNKTTADIDGEVHDDGEIWSRALWDIHKGLGRTRADKVIIESHFGYAPDTTFGAAARQVVQTARVLYGQGAADKARAAFVARRILK